MENNTQFVFYNLILIMHFEMVLHVSTLFQVENRSEIFNTNLNVIIETELGKLFFLKYCRFYCMRFFLK